jgi:hypothetical protein
VPIDPELAARLTLLRLRSAVPAERPLRQGVCAVGYGTAPVTTREAARRLASIHKPLACYAAVDGDVLVVELRLPERWRRALTFKEPSDLDREWYAERYGPDFESRRVLCLGRDEWELATFDELADWQRAYPFLGPGGSAEDDIATLHAPTRRAPPEAAAAARERGAVHVRWFLPADQDDGITGHIWCTRYEPNGRVVPECDRCSERPARFAVHWFEQDHPARNLCQRCIDEELQTYQFDAARELDRRRAELLRAERTLGRAELAELAEEQAMWWALRVTPPFVRTFIARHRQNA